MPEQGGGGGHFSLTAEVAEVHPRWDVFPDKGGSVDLDLFNSSWFEALFSSFA